MAIKTNAISNADSYQLAEITVLKPITNHWFLPDGFLVAFRVGEHELKRGFGFSRRSSTYKHGLIRKILKASRNTPIDYTKESPIDVMNQSVGHQVYVLLKETAYLVPNVLDVISVKEYQDRQNSTLVDFAPT